MALVTLQRSPTPSAASTASTTTTNAGEVCRSLILRGRAESLNLTPVVFGALSQLLRAVCSGIQHESPAGCSVTWRCVWGMRSLKAKRTPEASALRHNPATGTLMSQHFGGGPDARFPASLSAAALAGLVEEVLKFMMSSPPLSCGLV
ncbi:hypothetical protein SKAU_G00001500 [Synaphobranchus kaupii]|uniref:Uncharacterized protein n=1 Tax=Synaphobranchus kaupii TaxID=118154 RepID=A0A9Q1G8H4_SYNKA|nr:hypothetical protein SKAU_G00001500 [Synaphobranchus kaupii]